VLAAACALIIGVSKTGIAGLGMLGISRDKVEDARNALNVGDEVEAKIINIDRKSRVINLSVKSKDVAEEKDAIKQLRQQEPEVKGPTTIGDLIRAQMESQS